MKDDQGNRVSLVIITGLSGAGKTEALNYFEDAGYYCIDNLPASLLLGLIDFFSSSRNLINKIAVAIDLRSGYFFDHIYQALEELERKKIDFKILFLEASKSVIVNRYSLTRRKHPLVEYGDIAQGVEQERDKMDKLRQRADLVIDTTLLNAKELRIAITERLVTGIKKSKLLQISVTSFGYKYGLPENVDLVLDVRFLPNPFYDKDLKDFNGTHQKVIDFVLGRDETKKFLRMLEKMLDFLIPNYIAEGKSYLGIGIGCSGGKHRSVVLAEKIGDYLQMKGYSVKTTHRDINKE
ncbi:MAG: RNase adapter RapZ [Actinomycetota bacterium]|nr:RNase adapter RapZ [Actinomycetota bacterium]